MSNKIEKLTAQANSVAQNALRNRDAYKNYGDILFFDDGGLMLYFEERKILYLDNSCGVRYPNKLVMNDETYELVRRELLRNKIKDFALDKLPIYTAAGMAVLMVLTAYGIIFPRQTEILRIYNIKWTRPVRTNTYVSPTPAQNAIYYMNSNCPDSEIER